MAKDIKADKTADQDQKLSWSGEGFDVRVNLATKISSFS